MAIAPFTLRDFRVFDLAGFPERMAAIRDRLRPKLEALGEALRAPAGQAAGTELHPHVARHARRTVNLLDDTWVAFGFGRRGYKSAAHFKVAVSRHGVRFLFEVGPEHAAKAAVARAWKREARRLRPALGTVPSLAWFKDEHDEAPAAALADLDPAGWSGLADGLTRTRDGQLVLGRRVEAAEAVRWTAADYERVAGETFTALGGCFRLA